MTLIIASHGEDFTILGADSRGVVQSPSGTRVEINIMKKLSKLSEHVGILISGDGGVGNYLVEKFRETSREESDGVSIIAEKFAEFCREEFRKMSGVPKEYLARVNFIIAGLDQSDNGEFKIPKIFTLSSINGFILGRSPTPYEIQGKPFIALYKFAKSFAKQKDSIDKLSRFVAQTIYDTHRIDGDVGLPTWIARITSDGFEELPEEVVKDLYKSWEEETLEEIVSE